MSWRQRWASEADWREQYALARGCRWRALVWRVLKRALRGHTLRGVLRRAGKEEPHV